MGTQTQTRERKPSGYMTRSEVAELLAVHPATVLRWTRAEHPIPHVRVGARIRFRRADVERWVEDEQRRHVEAEERARKSARAKARRTAAAAKARSA